MKAPADAQARLLDLQTVDTAIARLRHRRRTLPELAEIATAQQARARDAEQIVAVRTRVSDLELEQTRSEADLTPVRDRLVRDQRRVDDGSITDPKQLRALLEEIQHLTQRISDLEDAQLEVMERLEASQGEVRELTERRGVDDQSLRALLGRRDEKLAELDAELSEREAERELVAADVPADLLTLYGRLADKNGGVGAAELRQGRCGGCQLEVTHADLSRYRTAPPDEVLRCEECNRILVRTPQSGL